jgi:hypothetical protein
MDSDVPVGSSPSISDAADSVGWAITKPLLAAYLTKKIGEKAKFQDADSIADAIRWAAAFLRGIKIE